MEENQRKEAPEPNDNRKKSGSQKGNQKARTHGIYAFRARGIEALDNDQRGVYIQLRDQFKSEPGRIEYRERLAANVAMLLELGFAHIGELAAKGYPVWKTPPVARMGVYLNALIRLIDSWPKDKNEIHNIYDLMTQKAKNKDKDNERQSESTTKE